MGANRLIAVTALFAALSGGPAAAGTVSVSPTSGPVVADSRLFIATNDGDVYAFGLGAGADAARARTVAPSSLHPDMSLRVTY